MLDSNTITDNQGAGIQITDSTTSNLRVIGNTITGNGDVAVDGSAANSLWVGNTVNANARNNSLASAAGLAVPSAQVNDGEKVLVGEPVKFTINVSGIGSIANVLWDFGEGLPATGLTGTHTYGEPGTYRVTAIAWDTNGEAAFNEITVSVTSSIPEPTTLLPAASVVVGLGLLGRRRKGRDKSDPAPKLIPQVNGARN